MPPILRQILLSTRVEGAADSRTRRILLSTRVEESPLRYYNMITMTILTLAIGLSVDFSAHIAHAWLHEDTSAAAVARVLA